MEVTKIEITEENTIYKVDSNRASYEEDDIFETYEEYMEYHRNNYINLSDKQ